MSVNVALLAKALDWAYEQDARRACGETSEWDQGAWCGTAHCIAGEVALLTGWRMHGNSMFVTREDGAGVEEDFVDHVAADALGLTDAQAAGLFSGSNSLEMLYEIAAELTDDAITPPPGLTL